MNLFNQKYVRLCWALWLIALLAGCKATPENKEGAEDEELLSAYTLSKAEAQKLGLVWGKPPVENLPVYTYVTGIIDLPPQYVAILSARLGGQIKSIYGLPGEHVHAGQVLAEIENLEWVDWQQSYLEDQAKLVFLEKEADRQQQLMKMDAGVSKQFEQTTSELNILKARQKGLETKLRFLQVDLNKLRSSQTMTTSFLLKSPFDGYIKAVHGAIGQKVRAEDAIFELFDPSHMHLELKVFESQSGQIQKGQQIWFQVPANDSSWHKAEVFLVGRNVDAETKSVNIHGHIEEEHSNWLPGSFVKARIKTGTKPVLAFNAGYFWKQGIQTYGYQVDVQSENVVIKKAQVADTSGFWLLDGAKNLSELKRE
jgi:cobalt-zinc-cadmium efflux system membrane fusion protein